MFEFIGFAIALIATFWLGGKYGTLGKLWVQGWPDLLAWVHLKKKSAQDEIARAQEKLHQAEKDLRAKRDQFGAGPSDDATPPAPPSA